MDCSTSGLPCPSPTPGACSNSCPLSQWYHPTISSSVVPFSCLQSFPASRSFLRSQLFASGGQSTGASASASVFPMNIQGWFPLELPGPGDSPESSSEPQFESTILWHSAFFMVQLSHQYMTTEKTIALTIWTFAGKVMSLLFNTLSRFSHGFSSKEQASFGACYSHHLQWLWHPRK